jgi:hypothetical protein
MSSDGFRVVAGMGGGSLDTNTGFIYTSVDGGTTWSQRAFRTNWSGVASSGDGLKLAAAAYGGNLFTSTDGGTNWTARAFATNWAAVVSSTDGARLAATVDNNSGNVYTSLDSGLTWAPHSIGVGRLISAITCTPDGMKLLVGDHLGTIYISSDFGTNWVSRVATNAAVTFTSLACSSDGSKILAGANPGAYTSDDGGATWIQRKSSGIWYGSAMSYDGTRLYLAMGGGGIWSSQGTIGTTVGAAGSLIGSPGAAIELQYVGNGVFVPLSHEGALMAN